MPNPFAILGAGALIGAAIVGAQMMTRYQIAPGVDAIGNPFVWRIDTRTGNVESCQWTRREDPDNPFAKIFDPPPFFLSCVQELKQKPVKG